MPNRRGNHSHKNPLMVGVSLYLPLDTLTEINEQIEGKTQSAKLRKCIEIGLTKASKQRDRGRHSRSSFKG